jgi:hypothetical protein
VSWGTSAMERIYTTQTAPVAGGRA